MTPQKREERARQIADALSDHQRWRSHGRGIPIRTLQNDLNVIIDDFATQPDLARLIREYWEFVVSVILKEGFSSFVTSRTYV